VPTLQFKGKSVIETYYHTVPHHRLEFDPKLSLLPKGEKPGLDGNLIIEGDNLLALKALLPTPRARSSASTSTRPTTPATKPGSTTTTSPNRNSKSGSAGRSATKARTPPDTTSVAACATFLPGA